MTSKAGMLSAEGRCYTFDQRADGFVPGEGVGVILLKRLSDAIRDQDPICGIIKGWGMNQDGKTNGITAPSVNSQIALEKEVYERFHIHPETISLVEAHGTGTKLGDPIEVEALTESFRAYTDKKQYCALGSVKSNIGHSSLQPEFLASLKCCWRCDTKCSHLRFILKHSMNILRWKIALFISIPSYNRGRLLAKLRFELLSVLLGLVGRMRIWC